MRVNVYAEEMTDRVEIITKTIEGQAFTGLRLYLELPASYHNSFEDGGPRIRPAKPGDKEQAQQLRAPFIHHPGDDDSSAVTFWGKRDLRDVLRIMLEKLEEHYGSRNGQEPQPGRYRKKPVVIAACQFRTNNEAGEVNMNNLVAWVTGGGGTARHDGTDIYITTLEGEMRAEVGDWIIRGVKGEFYPCKPDIFATTYDPA